MKQKSKILNISLATYLLIAVNLTVAQAESNVHIGGVIQQAAGANNNNNLSIVSSPQGNAFVGEIAQRASGSSNHNLINIKAFNVDAGLLHQTASGHGSVNELIVGDHATTNVSVSLGDIIQEAHNGEVNVIRIGSSLGE